MSTVHHDRPNSDLDRLHQALARGECLSPQALNLNRPELQAKLTRVKEYFERVDTKNVDGIRTDVRANGLLGERLAKTPCRIYDLPGLKLWCDTAFVDSTGRMYFSDTFFDKLIEDSNNGFGSMEFLLGHEVSHLVRAHHSRLTNYPPDIANIAQDIRINIDLIISAVGEQVKGQKAIVTEAAFDQAVEKYYSESIGPAIRVGCAMQSYEDYVKWKGLSEEQIAAILLAERNNRAAAMPKTISFPQLCEAVAQDLAEMLALDATIQKNAVAQRAAQVAALQVVSAGDPKEMATVLAADELSDLNARPLKPPVDWPTAISLTRKIGQMKGKVSLQEMQNLYISLVEIQDQRALLERNLQHDALVQRANGAQVQSVNCGDPFIDGLAPVERIMALRKLLGNTLNPQSGNPGLGDGGSIQVTDLDLPRSCPPGNSGAPGTAQSAKQAQKHEISAEDIANILQECNAKSAASALGYDDPESLDRQAEMAKEATQSSMSRAMEEMERVGRSNYAGPHLVDCAQKMITEFQRPKISWRLKKTEIYEGFGRALRFDEEEPSMQTMTPFEDQGLESEDDVGYEGSFVTGTYERPLIVDLMDTSGSVPIAFQRIALSESIQRFKSAEDNEAVPETAILFADTITRGAPIFVTPENAEELMARGVKAAGYGGTDLEAGLASAMMVVAQPESPSVDGKMVPNPFFRRNISTIIYWTDTEDRAPRREILEQSAELAGLRELPPIVFMAPAACYDPAFIDAVSGFAEVVYFDPKLEIEMDLEQSEVDIKARAPRMAA